MTPINPHTQSLSLAGPSRSHSTSRMAELVKSRTSPENSSMVSDAQTPALLEDTVSAEAISRNASGSLRTTPTGPSEASDTPRLDQRSIEALRNRKAQLQIEKISLKQNFQARRKRWGFIGGQGVGCLLGAAAVIVGGWNLIGIVGGAIAYGIGLYGGNLLGQGLFMAFHGSAYKKQSEAIRSQISEINQQLQQVGEEAGDEFDTASETQSDQLRDLIAREHPQLQRADSNISAANSTAPSLPSSEGVARPMALNELTRTNSDIKKAEQSEDAAHQPEGVPGDMKKNKDISHELVQNRQQTLATDDGTEEGRKSEKGV